jgi:histidine ammonia-lyase
MMTKLTLDTVESILFSDKKLKLDDSILNKVEESYQFLKEFAQNKIIYGVNTGFGPMAQYRIDEKDKIQLQYNLIRSHCAGIGEPLSLEQTKAVIIARLNTLSLGFSGIHPSVLLLMQELVNRDILPVIYQHGSVGASGDLVQLAHLALTLIGEGEVFYKGEIKLTKEVFELENLTPITIHIREGLSIMNGTSVMTGIGMVNLIRVKQLIELSITLSAMMNEIVQSFDDHYSKPLNEAKLHIGQRIIAEKMTSFLIDSQLIKKREDEMYQERNEDIFEEKVQEYYSLRCVPQILGPIYDTWKSAKDVLENEINSASDNPIVDVENQTVYHGGNFHGDYVSLELDKLKLAVTRLSMLSERQLNYIVNPKINNILPPFVNLGKLGFNFGLQAAQFTATSTTAENQTLSSSMYIHSIPNNNDNQDIVSMGTNAASICAKVIDNTFEVLSVQSLAVTQAVEYLEIQSKLSSKGKEFYDSIRKIVPAFKEDEVIYPYLKEIKKYLQNIKVN